MSNALLAKTDSEIESILLGHYGAVEVRIGCHVVREDWAADCGEWFAAFIRRPGGAWELLCRRRSRAELHDAIRRMYQTLTTAAIVQAAN